MRKHEKVFPYAPITVFTTLALAGCGGSDTPTVYKDAAECIANQPTKYSQQCRAAYEYAVEQAIKTGPKFSSDATCEVEFGTNNCQIVPNTEPAQYMPNVAGFAFDPQYATSRSHASSLFIYPLYTSLSRHSMYYGKTLPSMHKPNSSGYDKEKVRTVSRGGFGGTASAKSSWGSSSRRSGWGG